MTSMSIERGNSTDRRRTLARTLVDLGRNVALIGLLWIFYWVVRNSTADGPSNAFANAQQVMRFQDTLGLPREAALQAWVLPHYLLVKLANLYYIGVHFPATFVFLAWVWIRHRPAFARIRNVLIGLTMSALVIHLAFPLAPPRMFNRLGFVDTGLLVGPNPYDLSAGEAANQFAAMPSLHVGWALLVAFSAITLSRSRWRWFSVIHPLMTLFVVVITANHYWLDAIIAAALLVFFWRATRAHQARRLVELERAQSSWLGHQRDRAVDLTQQTVDV
ncbi:MAG: inositol phosphorylceramide synthase [Actinomycetia bacterium]|nr:inositol phosphorylceramide synthase [Actinomycetes bacterium]